MTAPAVATHDLSVAFGGVQAVDHVSLTVPRGQRRVIIGPNGAGKTTLFDLIGGQRAPRSGRVELHGRDVTHLAAHQRARAGLARTFQMTDLLADLSVRDNVLLAVAARSGRTRWTMWRPLRRLEPVASRADDLLAQWDLTGVADQRVSALAYGQQRLVEVVLAFAAAPTVMLLDEPTAGLSRADARTMTEVVALLPTDVTLVVIEHDVEVAFALGDLVTVLVDGAVLTTGRSDDVRTDPRVRAAYLGASPGAA